jgi:site-specific recombinase XerD
MKNADKFLGEFQAFLLAEKRVAQNTFDAYTRDLDQFFDFMNHKKKNLARGKFFDESVFY